VLFTIFALVTLKDILRLLMAIGLGVLVLPFTIMAALKIAPISGQQGFGNEFHLLNANAIILMQLFVHDPGLVHTKDKRVVTLADLKGLKLRAPNKTVAAAIQFAGATPVVLQVNQVMEAVKKGEIDGVVTNWANPLQDFNVHMKKHTDTKFYTSAFFIVMNKAKYAALPADTRAAVDAISGDAWVAELGALWNKWAQPVRRGADEPGHEIIVPDAATLAAWHEGLKPVTDSYLDGLAKSSFPGAHAAYRKVVELAR